jgi:nucleoside-diphosphate-sugar epimerase
MRVLITGVVGFIGSHLAAHLVTDSHTVVGVDDLSAGVIENVHPDVTFHRADIRSREVFPFFEGAAAAVHLAAKNCLLDCLQDPVATAGINVAGTANILRR